MLAGGFGGSVHCTCAVPVMVKTNGLAPGSLLVNEIVIDLNPDLVGLNFAFQNKFLLEPPIRWQLHDGCGSCQSNT